MVSEIQIHEALGSPLPIIDVRSPGEFEKGHIPGAVNVPLFSNEERAHVGTVYKQQSPEAAKELGYSYVRPKLDQFIETSTRVSPSKKVMVHCWRGGQRSHAFAGHLAENGFSQPKVISGGYKAFRNHVLDTFALPVNLYVLGGFTGSGKTHILQQLKKQGEQVLDLEGLACHKGSAFGGIDQPKQPTTEQFQNNLFTEWTKMDTSRPIWVEDESQDIGRVKIPLPLFTQMRNSVLYFVDIPKEERAKLLVHDYAGCDDLALEESIHRISKRLGGLEERQAVEHLHQKNYYDVALITLHYYDKWYLKGLQKRESDRVIRLELPTANFVKNAHNLLDFIQHDRH